MTNGPLVTVVTPSYNQGRFIRATIESVLSQDYPSIEYIIMDGGSTDETAAVVKDYSSRLTWISEKDRGQSHAINKGFQRARGSVLYWLNSDDLVLPGAFSHAVSVLRENPSAALVYGEGYLIDIDGNITERFPHTQPFNLWRLTYLSDYILQQSTFFQRFAFESVGWLNEDLHYSMDWDILIRIAKRHPVCYTPEFLGCLREYPAAKTSAGGFARISEIRRVLKQHTGHPLAPGVLVYALDTFREAASRWVHDALPSPMKRHSAVFRQFARLATGYLSGRIVLHAQGWYSDGWAGPRAHWIVPEGEGDIRICGELPPWAGLLRGQQLKIFCDGRLIRRAKLDPGPFTLVLPADEIATTRSVKLEIRAKRYIIPAVHDQANDRRRLSFLLREVYRRPLGPPRDTSPTVCRVLT